MAELSSDRTSRDLDQKDNLVCFLGMGVFSSVCDAWPSLSTSLDQNHLESISGCVWDGVSREVWERRAHLKCGYHHPAGSQNKQKECELSTSVQVCFLPIDTVGPATMPPTQNVTQDKPFFLKAASGEHFVTAVRKVTNTEWFLQ